MRACNLAPVCSVAQIEATLAAESQYGTNPSALDSDTDTLYDREELGLPQGTTPPRRITINGSDIGIFVSNPRISDTDNDGLSDQTEYLDYTNPNAGDSDGDGNSDYFEKYTSGTNPRQGDIKYKIWLDGLDLRVNAATWLDVNAGRTLTECDFRISVGTFSYDATLPAGTPIPCYYGEYIVDTNNVLQPGLGFPALEADIQTNGGNVNYCYLSIPLDYGKVEGSHYTATCSHNNGTYNDIDFTARFYFDRVEE